ncbi:NAD-dependent epimerase [Vibrio mytili]|uniref:Protein CapI n=1 Tax=Vibrio mytili TaxID=50718 RepID=A0A0C3I779_9VIBR|nr:NAD-dependent epimerase [Vibrio mytili]KIN10880.1 protein CapI [Vibrio mytili]
MKYLVTGAAGFIGSATVKKLTALGHEVVGVDNLNDYYDVELKKARLETIQHPLFRFVYLDISNQDAMSSLFEKEKFERVIHLAAQAGVRYSIENPHSYVESNVVGYLNVLEGCRNNQVQHLVYASSSSIYGLNNKVPFSTLESADHPISLYAATKKSNELMAHCYSHLYQIPTTGLRFFTVYGAWGRPDMAPFIFTKKILEGQTVDINNHGDMWRDFTHITDVVEGIIRVANVIPVRNGQWLADQGSPANSSAPFAVYNLGHGEPIHLLDFIGGIEKELDIKAKKNFREMQPGDVYRTCADTEDFYAITGYRPTVSIQEGIAELVTWYKEFYMLN